MTPLFRAIIWGGTLCGTLDAIAATLSFALRKVPPLRVWQNVASGLLGPRSFDKGWATGALGLLLHFFIAFSAAAVFCLGARSAPAMLRSPLLVGAAYGIVVFLVMNRIVLPLSAMPRRTLDPAVIITQLIIHVLFIGWPIALAAKFAGL